MAARSGASASAGKLINIDNGSTLTDVCVIDGGKVWRAKTLTTPYDLSKCFIEGLSKASKAIFGREDVAQLMRGVDHIRYSTTQGTNALVERKGQQIGLILAGGLSVARLTQSEQKRELFESLVGTRVVELDLSANADALEHAATRAVNALSSAGADRLVIAVGGASRHQKETRLRTLLLRSFPPHLLGALPVLLSHEVVEDDDDAQRTWTALLNAFLHPSMERFLQGAEDELRDHHVRNPLLIFRNDGHSGRVARTIAIKTYGSGPRGGLEGARALAEHYGFGRLLSIDVGGTTTDIGLIENGRVKSERRGKVEGISISFPLCDVVSVGVGGSSIIKVGASGIKVGPDSVGSAPGPACFGLGGTEATMTDAFLVQGLLDPQSFFGGDLVLDPALARSVIAERVGKGLGVSDDAAVAAMERAWVAKIADSIEAYTRITPDTVLAAFGGGGPLVVCRVAEAAGITRVIIPGLAAVFSAFGLGFSDIAHHYEAPLASGDASGLERAQASLIDRARRDMAGEGFALADCRIEWSLTVSADGTERVVRLPAAVLPEGLPPRAKLALTLEVAKPIPQPSLSGDFEGAHAVARAAGTRRVLIGSDRVDVPLYRVEDQVAGAHAAGPAVLEEAYFTCRIDPGWSFRINAAGDIRLDRT